MATLKYFTAKLYWFDVVGDSPAETGGDADADPDTKGINGGVTITPRVRGRDLSAVKAPSLTPNPAVFALAPIEARIDDGRLKMTAAQPDVRLVANCPVLELPEDAVLTYEFKPHHVIYNGKPQTLPTITIVAPEVADNSTVVVDLATVEWLENAQSTGGTTYIRQVPDGVQLVNGDVQFTAQGQPLGPPLDLTIAGIPTTMDNISDATTVGKAVTRAADQAAARSAISAVDAAAVASQISAATTNLATTQQVVDYAAPKASPTFTGTVSGVTKGMVGLGSVDNTSDASKPVSTAQQTALNGKQDADADLTAIAALTTTTFGRSLLTQADAPTARMVLESAAYIGQQLYGTGAPASTLGRNGDTYTDYTAQKKYTKAAGAWTVTTDTTVSKEVTLAGTWANSGGTLTTDTSDGMTVRKIVTTANTDATVTLTLSAAVDMTNKMVRLPMRMDQMSGWDQFAGEISLSDTVGFTGRYIVNVNSKDILRGNEVEAFTFCPSTCYVSNTPNLAAIRYIRFYWRDSGTSRSGYMGQPVLIG